MTLSCVLQGASYLTSPTPEDCSEKCTYTCKAPRTVSGAQYEHSMYSTYVIILLVYFFYISTTNSKSSDQKVVSETNVKVKNIPIFKKFFLYFNSRMSSG